MRVVYTKRANKDLVRLKEFLAEKNRKAAIEAIELIVSSTSSIGKFPLLGKEVRGRRDIREIFSPFGSGGYIIRYRISTTRISILKIWHTKEDRF